MEGYTNYRLVCGLTLLLIFMVDGYQGIDLLDATIDYVTSLAK